MTMPLGLRDSQTLLSALKAAAEPTRLRILALLADGELNVKDLIEILHQSQPRISRHLKLLLEAGLVERFREGSWVYFHVSDHSAGGRLARDLLAAVDRRDPIISRDRDRSDALKRDREQSAQAYFQAHASDWDRIRSLYIAEERVEAAIAAALGPGLFGSLVDLGTGTGRMLELLGNTYRRGLGLDVNQSMLACARSRLKAAGCANAQVRHGDIYHLPLIDRSSDAVILHQVLHYLSDPARAIAEAGRILASSGKLLIVDFAPHDVEVLRERHAHERLGIADDQMTAWLSAAGLSLAALQRLEPEPGDSEQKLTVSLWLAAPAAPPAIQRPEQRERSLEGVVR